MRKTSGFHFSLRFLLFLIVALFAASFFLKDSFVEDVPTPIIPTPTMAPEPKVTEVHSPDGKMNVVMEMRENEDRTFTHSFFIDTIPATSKKLLFTIVASEGEITFTPNAWSPDNKLLYLLKNQNGNIDALVFRADGTSFANDEVYLEVLPLFTKRGSDYYITNITGWDSETLLHVLTAKDKRTKGPDFWFEVPTLAFYQLAS